MHSSYTKTAVHSVNQSGALHSQLATMLTDEPIDDVNGVYTLIRVPEQQPLTPVPQVHSESCTQHVHCDPMLTPTMCLTLLKVIQTTLPDWPEAAVSQMYDTLLRSACRLHCQHYYYCWLICCGDDILYCWTWLATCEWRDSLYMHATHDCWKQTAV
jgi:hypothetical protein